MATILETLRKDTFAAMKAGEETKVGILQIAVGSIKNEELKKGEALTDEESIRVLRSEVKKLKDAIEQYKAGGRDDLLERESAQLAVIEAYLPALMSEDDIAKIVEAKMKELNVVGMSDMGKLMGVVMKEVGAKADGGVVKQVVTRLLTAK